ncbi:hypothetical protein ABPG75_001427 [Micractinium tetrahymenae]
MATFTFQLTPHTQLVLSKGDLTKWRGDAIVNAANEQMLGGKGVDGAIHSAAGPQLKEACRAVKPVGKDVHCPTGEARITPGFNLPARHVIHTVGPRYAVGGWKGYQSLVRKARAATTQAEADALLGSAYRRRAAACAWRTSAAWAPSPSQPSPAACSSSRPTRLPRLPCGWPERRLGS